jgi:hypothetical protein
MAFVTGPFQKYVTGSLSEVGVSDYVYAVKVDACIWGTFTGSAELQCQTRSGEWIKAATLTVGEMGTASCNAIRPWRIECTSIISGNITYTLEGGE